MKRMKKNNLVMALIAITCGIAINILFYYYFFETNFILKACFYGIFAQILFWIISSWLENITYFLYMKMHQYKMQSICIWPLEIYLETDISININCLLINILDISSSIKMEEVGQEDKRKIFYVCYQKIVGILFVANMILILGSILLSFKSPTVGYSLFALWLQKIVIESMEPDKLFIGGRYARHAEMQFYLTSTRIAVENYDKTEIYHYLLKNIRIEEGMNVRQYDLLEECLLDSLLERKKYFTEEMQYSLYHFLYEFKTSIYQRMAFLLIAYCNMFGEKQMADNLYKRYVDENIRCRNLKYKEKIMKYKTNDFRLWSDVRNGNKNYRNKIKLLAEREKG